MPQEPASEAGKRFSDDLRRIREAQGVSIDDVNDETKIPRGLIEAFEETALFDHPQFNRVYLRSFTRTYAQVIGISADIALEALEEALSDAYRGRLAVEYLGEEPEEPRSEAASAAPEQADEGAAVRDESAAAAPPPASEEAEEAAERPRKSSEEAEKAGAAGAAGAAASAEADAPKPTSEESAPPSGKEAPEAAGEPATQAADEDWTSASPPAAKDRPQTTRGGRSRGTTEYADGSSSSRTWIFVGIGVVLVAAIAWGVITLTSGGDAEPAAEMAAADTAAAAAQEEPQAAQPAGRDASTIPTIGDSLDVRVIAAEGVLDPFRATIDDDLRRPYWVEEGDSMEFDAANRIIIEELLDNMQLKIEGEPYPTDRRDDQNRIVITRDTVEAYFESLAGAAPLVSRSDTVTATENP